MKLATAVATLVMMTTAAASDTINCLAYLAADAEFSKATDLYQEADQSIAAWDIRRQAVEAATKAHRRAKGEAETIQRQAREVAHQAHRQGPSGPNVHIWTS